MNCYEISDLNKRIKEDLDNFMTKAENLYTTQINSVAEGLLNTSLEKPIVLLSGPSGSGKTTTAQRIADVLSQKGVITHTVSMDDYFLPKELMKPIFDEEGNIDFESPYRLDIPLLLEHIEKIKNCQEVLIPTFDFPTQRISKHTSLKRNKNELVILEGIHALNPEVTGEDHSYTNCIYVSVRSRIYNSTGNMLHPSNIRLSRRIIRDTLFRGRTVEQVIEMFRSVQRGEDKFIMPFKYRSDYDIDTFLPYELSIYRDILLSKFESLTGEIQNNKNYIDILEFIRDIEPINTSYLDDKSLVFEFIGNV